MDIYKLFEPDPDGKVIDLPILKSVEWVYTKIQSLTGIVKWKMTYALITIYGVVGLFDLTKDPKRSWILSFCSALLVLWVGFSWMLRDIAEQREDQNLADRYHKMVPNKHKYIRIHGIFRLTVLAVTSFLVTKQFRYKDWDGIILMVTFMLAFYLSYTDTYPNDGLSIKDRIKGLKNLFGRKLSPVRTAA